MLFIFSRVLLIEYELNKTMKVIPEYTKNVYLSLSFKLSIIMVAIMEAEIAPMLYDTQERVYKSYAPYSGSSLC